MDKSAWGCLGVSISAIVVLALALFLSPAIVMIAWNKIAVAHFNLPQFTYWEFFWATTAIQTLFKASTNVTTNKGA